MKSIILRSFRAAIVSSFLCLLVLIGEPKIANSADQTAGQWIADGQAALAASDTSGAIFDFDQATPLALQAKDAPSLLGLADLFLSLSKIPDCRSNFQYSFDVAINHANYSPDISDSGDNCGAGLANLQSVISFFDAKIAPLGASTDPAIKAEFNLMKDVRDRAQTAIDQGCTPAPVAAAEPPVVGGPIAGLPPGPGGYTCTLNAVVDACGICDSCGNGFCCGGNNAGSGCTPNAVIDACGNCDSCGNGSCCSSSSPGMPSGSSGSSGGCGGC